ncbi:hypothetical protein [Streptomyces sp. NBC_00986]|uniref:hypothetical protein n=1 Tax=Streptomyces sp. NBC_00986 TaxID=2903702 RepID=UPI00386F1802|nr:hypothetical protein OG504_01790 [Streptomyces sp. NBC_00986]
MADALWLLAVLGLLGGFDTVCFHEIRGRLPAHVPGLQPELKLHAGRSSIYVAVFGTLPWIVRRGAWAVVLAALLLSEISITLADFIIEDQVRKPMGGLLPGERVTHTIMAIVYGAMLAHLIPVILHWRHLPSRLAIDLAPVPLWLRLGLSALAVGTFASATRDAYAVIVFPRPLARRPWQAPGVGARRPRPLQSGAAE